MKVVLAIIAIFSLLVCLWCVGFGFWAARMAPPMLTQAAVLGTLASVQSGLEGYKADMGIYPTTLGDRTLPPIPPTSGS